jgi:hypothetical protein
VLHLHSFYIVIKAKCFFDIKSILKVKCSISKLFLFSFTKSSDHVSWFNLQNYVHFVWQNKLKTLSLLYLIIENDITSYFKLKTLEIMIIFSYGINFILLYKLYTGKARASLSVIIPKFNSLINDLTKFNFSLNYILHI